MFAITASPTWFAKSDDFKKIGKKIQKQRKTEVDKIKDKIGDIARDERKRVQDMFKEHQDVIKKGEKKTRRRATLKRSIFTKSNPNCKSYK